jgi:hypothetical protein
MTLKAPSQSQPPPAPIRAYESVTIPSLGESPSSAGSHSDWSPSSGSACIDSDVDVTLPSNSQCGSNDLDYRPAGIPEGLSSILDVSVAGVAKRQHVPSLLA